DVGRRPQPLVQLEGEHRALHRQPVYPVDLDRQAAHGAVVTGHQGPLHRGDALAGPADAQHAVFDRRTRLHARALRGLHRQAALHQVADVTVEPAVMARVHFDVDVLARIARQADVVLGADGLAIGHAIARLYRDRTQVPDAGHQRPVARIEDVDHAVGRVHAPDDACHRRGHIHAAAVTRGRVVEDEVLDEQDLVGGQGAVLAVGSQRLDFLQLAADERVRAIVFVLHVYWNTTLEPCVAVGEWMMRD